MSDQQRRRGRPKGTGINDRATLEKIAGLIAANANLKPTTAIRQVGITDPSVVRRLRDKLKVTPESGAPTVGPISAEPPLPTSSTNQTPEPPQIASITTDQRQLPQADITQPVTQDLGLSPPKTPGNPEVRSMPVPGPALWQSPTPVTDPTLEALRLAAEAAAAVSRLYLHCATFATQVAPFTLALRSQVIMSQWMAAMLAGQPSSPILPSN